MIRLVRNYLRRTMLLTLLVSLGAFAFQAVVVRAYVSFNSQGPTQIGRQLPKAVQTFLGLDRLPLTTLRGFLSVSYQHPFLLAALLAIPIGIAAALLAGQVERKTMALLLARPINRFSLVLAPALTIALQSLIVVLASVAGTFAGVRWMGVADAPSGIAMFNVASNLYMLLLAVGGVSLAFSAILDERSDAMGWVVTLVLLSYVWNFLAQIWPTAKPYEQYSLFSYYTPRDLLLTGTPLLWNWELLGIVAAAGLVCALAVYWRRDLSV